jgi:hypothetical protein
MSASFYLTLDDFLQAENFRRGVLDIGQQVFVQLSTPTI